MFTCSVRPVNSAGEQFIPRDSEIHQLVISQLSPFTNHEHWFTAFQAILGLPSSGYSNGNWQSMFQRWLSGSGRGPPIWKTLLNVLEASGIRELECIAHYLKARLHGMCPLLHTESTTMKHAAWTLADSINCVYMYP